MRVKLEESPLEFQLPGSDETYRTPDPLALMIDMMKDGLVDGDGKHVSAESLEEIRTRVKSAFGFPSLTFSQLIQVLNSTSAYVADVQKKTSLMQTSQPPTASSPRK